MTTILKCENLTKRYGSMVALNGINLELTAGKIIGLLGPNGSGKTTFIKLVNRLLTPSSGSLTVFDLAPSAATKDLISYLPDCEFLPKWMTIIDLLECYRTFYSDFNYSKACDMLTSLDIDPKKKMKFLSKGTKEKVQLILAMSREAKIYILDEPIAGVDPAAREYILQTILSNYAPDALVIISTHLIADVESVLDEAIFLKDGNVVLHKSIDEIRAETGMSVDGYFREVFKC